MKNRGFSLLEAIIVLGIITAFFAVSMPFFARFTENAKLDTAARSVVSALRTARAYAITNNAPRYMFFNTGTNPHSYYIADSAGALPDAAIEKVYMLPAGLSFDSVGFTSQRAMFEATGALNEAGAETTVNVAETASSRMRIITVERTTGRARIQ